MKVYISGVMQGSITGHGIQGQDYRQVISEAVRKRFPNAEIYDPYAVYPDSVTYDDQRAKQALFEMAEEAAATDLLIAYLPEASMGTALEMVRAYDNGKTILSISSLEQNWFIRAVSARAFKTLAEFCTWMEQTNLGAF